jgi:hypothetical protein
MNPRAGERRSSDYSQYPGSYVLPFHVGLPRASFLVLPTCRTAGRKIDSRCVLFPRVFLPSIPFDLLSLEFRSSAARTFSYFTALPRSATLPLAMHQNPLEKRFSALVYPSH